MGGQACVLYGAAEFSRDLDLVLLVDDGNLRHLDDHVREFHPLAPAERAGSVAKEGVDRPRQIAAPGRQDERALIRPLNLHGGQTRKEHPRVSWHGPAFDRAHDRQIAGKKGERRSPASVV
jgi:hypothetical protein